MQKAQIIRAQGEAYKLLRKYAQSEAAPVELEAIAYGEGLKFSIEPLAGCEARLVRDAEGGGFARLSDRIKESGRIRFALAHELGHFTMHVGKSQTRACTNGDMSDYRKSPMEIEANVFAGEILMPRRLFQELAARMGPSFEEVGFLAARFNVSLTAAILRYIDLGPVDEMTLVCIGPDKRVKWSKGKDFNWNFWVEQGMEISSRSMAFCAFEAKDSVDATIVDADVWFKKSHGIEVTEQCLFMPDYGFVLSLLVVERV